MIRRHAVLAALLSLALLPFPTFAQDSAHGGGGSPWSGSAFLGFGEGPTPALAVGARAVRSVGALGGAYAEASFRTPFGGACSDDWPGSYRCAVNGTALSLGGTLDPLAGRRLGPAVEAGFGLYHRGGGHVVEHATSPLLSVGAALRLGVGASTELHLFGRRTWIDDDAYQALMGEALRYWTFGVGVGLG